MSDHRPPWLTVIEHPLPPRQTPEDRILAETPIYKLYLWEAILLQHVLQPVTADDWPEHAIAQRLLPLVGNEIELRNRNAEEAEWHKEPEWTRETGDREDGYWHRRRRRRAR